MMPEPMAEPLTYRSLLFGRLLAALRANVVPGLILQGFLVALVLAYLYVPAVHEGLETAATWKGRFGYAYSAVASAFFGGILPLVIQRVVPAGREKPFFAQLPFVIPFWAGTGVVVDALYRLQGVLFGDVPTPGVVAAKVMVDQFALGPCLLITQAIVLTWRREGYSLGATRRVLGLGWYVREVIPLHVAGWLIWIPAVIVVYSLKPTLQIPVQNLVQSFWALILFFMATRSPSAAPPLREDAPDTPSGKFGGKRRGDADNVGMTANALKIMVLAGGPDRERPVSLASGAQVAAALVEAGHEVLQRDVGPRDTACLDEFALWGGDVIFPVLHGDWGEGGPLQGLLDERAVAYVGSRAEAAALCMDKHRAKQAMARAGLATPEHQLLAAGDPLRVAAPLVIKPPCEGSSIDLVICPTAAEAEAARRRLEVRHRRLLAERFIAGKELTVGVLARPHGNEPLPPIHIIPATAFYDYEAKYEREDTRYLFDIDLPAATLQAVRTLAVQAHEALGCRHLSRVDFIVDEGGRPWMLELNTMPGFTSHSLLPMAARHAGVSLPTLVDSLARLALAGQAQVGASAR